LKDLKQHSIASKEGLTFPFHMTLQARAGTAGLKVDWPIGAATFLCSIAAKTLEERRASGA
jgi:hypothetical protein